MSQEPSSTKTSNVATEILLDVWSEINRNFYDTNFNGVDWSDIRRRYTAIIPSLASEDDFYKAIDQMLAELRSSHVSFNRPPQFQLKRGIVPGLEIEPIEGNYFISTVASNSQVAAEGLKRGDKIIAVDTVPVVDHALNLSNVITKYVSIPTPAARDSLLKKLFLIGDLEKKVEIKIATPSGAIKTVQLKRGVPLDTPFEAKTVGKDIAYLRFSSWVEPNDTLFEKKMQELTSLSAIILDLRGNPGGNDDPTLRIASLFFPEGTPWGIWRERSGREGRFSTGKAKIHYAGKLVVLIDDASASASENFSVFVQETGRGKIIGRQSCGCLTATRWEKVKGGGKVGYPHRIPFTMKGQKVEGRGVTPDIIIQVTEAQLVNEQDPVLAKAIEVASGL